MVSVSTTHGIPVIFITEFISSLCMNIISVLYSSIRCCCLNSVSKSFKETAILSLPNRFETSAIRSMESSFEKLSTARFAPAYRIFFTSSERRILPPAIIGMLIARFIFLIRSMASSCSSSVWERSNTISSSAPFSQYCFAREMTSSDITAGSSNHLTALPPSIKMQGVSLL